MNGAAINRPKKRRAADYYPTTPHPIEALRRWLVTEAPADLSRRPIWYEPAAGYGAIMRGLQHAGTTKPRQWMATELLPGPAEVARPYCSHLRVADALQLHDERTVALPSQLVVVTNPPFSKLDAFVSMALDYVEAGAWAIIMTRGQWLDEKGRAHLRERRTPAYQLRLCWRINFSRGSTGPSATHCWNVWNPKHKGHWGTVVRFLERPVLDSTHGELVAAHRLHQQLAGKS